MNVRSWTLVTVLVFLTTGCVSTYRQAGVEQLAPSQVAAIEIENPTCFGGCIIVTLVDGKRRGFGLFGRYELVPGPHEIGAQYEFPGATSGAYSQILSFTAEAGHTYRIEANADLKQMKWSPTIVDTESGRVVSRDLGSKFVW